MVFVVAFTEYNDWRFVFAVFAVPAVYVLDISSSVQLVFVALVWVSIDPDTLMIGALSQTTGWQSQLGQDAVITDYEMQSIRNDYTIYLWISGGRSDLT